VADGRPIFASQWVQLRASVQGPAQVEEVIDVDFGDTDAELTGIFREVPRLDRDVDVEVTSTDAPTHVEVDRRTGTGALLTIGDPDVVLRGRHRWELGYRLTNAVVRDRFEWQVVGYGPGPETERLEAHIVGPFELDGIRCRVGNADGARPCDEVREIEPGHVVVVQHDVGGAHGMEITGTVGDELDDIPPEAEPPDRPD
jgi:hypothetical protein